MSRHPIMAVATAPVLAFAAAGIAAAYVAVAFVLVCASIERSIDEAFR